MCSHSSVPRIGWEARVVRGRCSAARGIRYLRTMDTRELMERVSALLDAHGTGLLATVGRGRVRRTCAGSPRRSCATGRGRSTPSRRRAFAKVVQVRAHPGWSGCSRRRRWTRSSAVRGTINVVENPSLRAEVLEVLGPRLRTFWKLAHDARDLVVLETVVEEATQYLPMQGRKDVVRF